MTAMPSPDYLGETTNKALVHSVPPGSGTMFSFLGGREFKICHIVLCILDGDFGEAYWRGL